MNKANEIQITRKLRRITRKIIHTESHIQFLKKCVNEEITPKGFRLRWRSAYESDETEKKSIHTILQAASGKLVTKAIEHNEKYLHVLQQTKLMQQNEIRLKATEAQQAQINGALDAEERLAICKIGKVKQNKYRHLNVATEDNNYHYFDRYFEDKNKEQKDGLTEDQENIQDIDGFKIIKVLGDGNCLFQSISYLRKGEEKYHSEIRHQVIKYMEENKTNYESYIDGPWSQHIKKLCKTEGGSEIWGTEAEICAASNLYDTNIVIYSKINNQVIKQTFESQNKTHNMEINILLENNHYDPLIPVAVKPTSGAENDINLNDKPDQRHSNQDNKNQWKMVNKSQTRKRKWNTKKKICRTAHVNQITNRFEVLKDMTNETLEDVNDPNLHVVKCKEDNTSPKATVYNLSQKTLNKDEISLLEKGCKFVPTREKVNISSMLADLREWERRMRLKEYYYSSDNDNEDIKINSLHNKIHAREQNKIFMLHLGI